MVWLLMVLCAGVVFLAPVTLQADLRHGSDTQGRVRLQCCRLHKTWRWERKEGADQRRDRRNRLLHGLLHGDNQAWRYLLRHSRLMALDVQVLLRTGDAARSALLSGALHGIVSCVPPLRRKEVRIQILPEFFREHSTVCLRCIIRLKLGTLILTAGMLGLRMLQARQLKESEAM